MYQFLTADFSEPFPPNFPREIAQDFTSFQLLRFLNLVNYDLPSLRCFTLHVWKHILPQHYPAKALCKPIINLPILAQLEQIYFYSLDTAETLYDSVVKYAIPNQKLKRFGLPSPISNYKVLHEYLQLASRCNLLTKMTNFMGVYYPKIKKPLLDRFVGRFSALTSLWIYMKPFKFSILISSLAALKQLTYLQISMHFEEIGKGVIIALI